MRKLGAARSPGSGGGWFKDGVLLLLLFLQQDRTDDPYNTTEEMDNG
jgi:hypothetical protein